MNCKDEYREKLVTPEEAVKVVRSGDWVEYGQFALQAVVLDKALAARKGELQDVKIRATTRAIGIPEVVKADPTAEHFAYHNLHFSGHDRKAHDQGLCWFVPILYHEVPRYYRENCELDVAMMPVTPMDRNGYFNFSLSNSHSRAICDKAKTLIVEVNPNLPVCLGGREENVHISEVDLIVESDWKVPELPSAEPSEVDKKIASLIMNVIEDGSCIQLGIGGMPNAVGSMIAQSGLKDLGIHTEMFCDSMMEMAMAGRVTGACKTTDRGKIAYAFCLGSQACYEFLDRNPLCASYPVNYTNDPFVIAQNDNVIAINASDLRFTGNKVTGKTYYHYSGYPGGLKKTALGKMMMLKPEKVFTLAVRGMLPKGRLGRKQLTKLHVYAGSEHPHTAQKPAKLEL